MERLRPVEMKLVDELFGMNSGYVLDFNNRTFAEFFQSEVGVDIYDAAYAVNGTSKGKHLRAFLNVAQTRAIVRALTALWEYRETDRLSRGEPEKVANARQRLSAIVEKLGGSPLPSHDVAAEVAEPTAPAGLRPHRADLETLQRLTDRFYELHGMSDEPHARGRHFEMLLADLFNAWGMQARGSFSLVGEQIDGSFQVAGDTYLLEAKWHRDKIGAEVLRGFQGKVTERPEWTRGLFVSYSGFTEVGLQAFTAKRIILADGMDILDALTRRISVADIVAAKVRYAAEFQKPYAPVRDLFPG